jgi:hypothetical protein
MFVRIFLVQDVVRREYVCIPNPLDLVYTYKFLQKYLSDPKDLLLDDALAFLHSVIGHAIW